VEVARLQHAWAAASDLLLTIEQLPLDDPRRASIPKLSARSIALGEELVRRGVV
jgi:hypothetical protein